MLLYFCFKYFNVSHLQIWFLQRVSYSSWWGRRRQLSCRTRWPGVMTWPNLYPTTSSSPPTTRTWQVPLTTLILALNFSYMINWPEAHLGGIFLSVNLQPVSSPACPLRRCTVSVCCPAAAVWSWTAGRANLQMKSPSLPTASPWQLRSSSRWLHVVLGTPSVGCHTLRLTFHSNF